MCPYERRSERQIDYPNAGATRTDKGMLGEGKGLMVEEPKSVCVENGGYSYSGSSVDLEDEELVKGLKQKPWKNIPFRFLYDDYGSVLFEKITGLDEYYPYREEKRIFEECAQDIVDEIEPGTVLVELGIGDGSKTTHILQEMIKRDGAENVKFVGIDVSREALRQAERSIGEKCPDIPMDSVQMIEAEYLDGVAQAQGMVGDKRLCVLWLGSSIGNFTREESVGFLNSMRRVLNERALLLLGTDLWKDASVLHAAYDDSKGVTREFIGNGMMNVLKECKHELACERVDDLWDYQVHVNSALTQVEMWVVAKQTIHEIVPDVDIEKGEKILVEISRKFTLEDVSSIAFAANYTVEGCWKTDKFSIQMLCTPLEAMERCWKDTDDIFSCIEDWNANPIDLRHPFCFYYGHCAAFSKIRILPQAAITSMDEMFSRGIDPNVSNPLICHIHPEIPEEWPSREAICEYVEAARTSIKEVVQRVPDMHRIRLAMEHERMHQETLCYMLAQLRKISGGVVNGKEMEHHNPGQARFFFDKARYMQGSQEPTNDVVTIPESYVSLGIPKMTKMENFLWDNEYGEDHAVLVGAFKMHLHPVTTSQFKDFIEAGGYSDPSFWSTSDFKYLSAHEITMPATWTFENGEYMIHMPEAKYSLPVVSNEPVFVSLCEASAYAKWAGGRIMTEEEYEATMLSVSGARSKLMEGGWEWTKSVFKPLMGFEPEELYPEYSTDFFDGLHFTLKGSSPYTHRSMRRKSFRNFYQANYRYMFAKFRLISSTD